MPGYEEMPELADWAGLENRRLPKGGPWVRIPFSSPKDIPPGVIPGGIFCIIVGLARIRTGLSNI